MIKKSVLNTFKRIGIDHTIYDNEVKNVRVDNRFGGGSCETTQLIAYLIQWVYSTSNAYEMGIQDVRLDDFDRVRYFILEQDPNAYMTCID